MFVVIGATGTEAASNTEEEMLGQSSHEVPNCPRSSARLHLELELWLLLKHGRNSKHHPIDSHDLQVGV